MSQEMRDIRLGLKGLTLRQRYRKMMERMPDDKEYQAQVGELLRQAGPGSPEEEKLDRVLQQIRDLAESLPPDQVQPAMKQIIAAIEKDSPELAKRVWPQPAEVYAHGGKSPSDGELLQQGFVNEPKAPTDLELKVMRMAIRFVSNIIETKGHTTFTKVIKDVKSQVTDRVATHPLFQKAINNSYDVYAEQNDKMEPRGKDTASKYLGEPKEVKKSLTTAQKTDTVTNKDKDTDKGGRDGTQKSSMVRHGEDNSGRPAPGVPTGTDGSGDVGPVPAKETGSGGGSIPGSSAKGDEGRGSGGDSDTNTPVIEPLGNDCNRNNTKNLNKTLSEALPMILNNKQKVIIGVAISITVIALILPPWKFTYNSSNESVQYIGPYAPVFIPPESPVGNGLFPVIDISRLLFPMLAIYIACTGLFFVFVGSASKKVLSAPNVVKIVSPLDNTKQLVKQPPVQEKSTQAEYASDKKSVITNVDSIKPPDMFAPLINGYLNLHGKTIASAPWLPLPGISELYPVIDVAFTDGTKLKFQHIKENPEFEKNFVNLFHSLWGTASANLKYVKNEWVDFSEMLKERGISV